MSINVEKTENKNEVKLTFTIEAEKFDSAMKRVYAKSAKYFSIPGFRKGKAPMAMVEKQYGSEIFYEDTFNEIVPEVYEKELKENNIEAVSNPNIDITQIGKGKDLIFTAVVQVKPEFKVAKYKGIELKKVEYNVTDENIDHELKHMAERNARIVNVEDRAVKKGDITVIDFEGSVDGVPFEGGKSDNYELTIGSNTFIPGFEDQIIGMKIEEEKDIKVKFPEEYHAADLAGKDAVFKVKLHEIKEKELPKIDDDFAKDVSEFDTLKELKNSIKEKLEKENEQRAKTEVEEAAIEQVSQKTKIDIPSGMIETETDNILRDLETRLSYQGMTLEQYLSFMQKTKDEVKKEYADQAEKTVKTRLVLEAIVKEENIEADQVKVEEKIEEMAKAYGRKAEELKNNEQLVNYIKDTLKTEEAISLIIDNAKIK